MLQSHVSQMLWMDEIRYFPSECIITFFSSKLTNQVEIVLVPYQNKLWVLYLDCTRGYLQFDMLVAIVSVRNNETSLLGRVLQTIRVPAQNVIFLTMVIMFTK